MAGPEARRAGGEGRAGPAAPSPRRLKGSGERGWPTGRAVRVPCAPHLRTAPCVTVSAGDSLEGGHSLQPLHTAELRRASQNGGAHGSRGGRSPGPILCEARDLSTWNIPPPRMHLTREARRQGTEPAGTAWLDAGDCRPPSGAPSSSVFSGRDGKGSGRQRRAAAGRSGDWRRGDSGPGSGGTRTGRPLSSSVSRPVALVRARRWPRRLRLPEGGVAMPAVAVPATRQTCSAAAGTVGTEAARALTFKSSEPNLGLYVVNVSRWTSERPSVPLLHWAGLLGFNFQVQEQIGGMTCWHFTRARLTLRRQRML